MGEQVNNDRQAAEAKERRNAAKQDAQVLAEAEVIKGNSERLALAQKLASEMALENANKSKAFATIASRSLEYPEMEREREQEQGVGPSAGI